MSNLKFDVSSNLTHCYPAQVPHVARASFAKLTLKSVIFGFCSEFLYP